MITEILQYLRNWFCKSKYYGDFIISGGNIVGDDLQLTDGQYFRIIGSALNDGVYQYPATTLQSETFSGSVWGLVIPPAILALVDEISNWQTKYAGSASSPYQSESYSRGSYSRTYASAGEKAVTWQAVFADRLAPWRKL